MPKHARSCPEKSKHLTSHCSFRTKTENTPDNAMWIVMPGCEVSQLRRKERTASVLGMPSKNKKVVIRQGEGFRFHPYPVIFWSNRIADPGVLSGSPPLFLQTRWPCTIPGSSSLQTVSSLSRRGSPYRSGTPAQPSRIRFTSTDSLRAVSALSRTYRPVLMAVVPSPVG